MKLRGLWRLVGMALCALVCVPFARADGVADAAQRSVARELGTAGMEAYFKQDYPSAAEQLDRAYRLFAAPTLGLWSGRAFLQIGQWVRAAERLREAQLTSAAVGDSEAQRRAQADAAAELAALLPRIPRLTIQVVEAPVDEVSVTIDQARIGREIVGIAWPIDPGPHVVAGVFRGQRVELSVSLAEGDAQLARLVFEKADAAPPQLAAAEPLRSPQASAEQIPVAPPEPLPAPASALRHAAIITLSVGGVALATSLVTTLLARDRLDGCARRDGDIWCSDQVADAYEGLRTASAVSVYTGAVMAGAGALMWLLDASSGKAASEPTVRLLPSPLGVQISTAF